MLIIGITQLRKRLVLYWQNINGAPNKRLRRQDIKENLRRFRKPITIIDKIKGLRKH